MPAARKKSAILRWLKRIGLGLLALIVLVVVGGALFEAIARHNARRDYPAPGKLVDVGGRRMHIDCRGHGAPIVVLESGLDTSGSLAWSAVHDKIAGVTRTCAYDRAGISWSDPKSTVHDADSAALDLHATLAGAGEKGPYVMVGHSLGGPMIMDYTRHYPADVAGLVFVDTSHPDQLERFKGTPMGGPTKLPLSYRVMAATTWIGWTRLPGASPGQPNAPASATAAAAALMAPSVSAAMAEMKALPESFRQGGQLRTLGDRPLVVLTAMKPYPDAMLKQLKMTRAQGAQVQGMWKAMQDEEAGWSTRSRHQLVPDASHYIQFDRPDVVIAAVTEVVGEVRADQAKAVPAKTAR